jgi:type IV pilus assembly protein PilM
MSGLFYKDKPLFGLDIGFSTVKVMQLNTDGKQHKLVGYGIGEFDSKAIENGVVVEPTTVAKSIMEMFDKHIIGEINTRRVALAIPASRTFTRTINLPAIKEDEVSEAVRLEAEQYIPVPIDDLYLDHITINQDENGMEVLAVATPKKIVDSQMQLVRLLGLEPVGFDTSILAAARVFEKQDEHNDIPAVLIDFGSMSADITVHDKTVIVTGTIPHGGDIFTDHIAKKLGVSREEAHIIKTKYGIGKSKKQAEILEVLRPPIEQLAKEVRRMIRYHEERSGSEQKIGQIVAMGGGANMPGLSDFLTDTIRLPVRTCEPWQSFHMNKLQAPSRLEKSMYVTVAGLALIQPKELFS